MEAYPFSTGYGTHPVDVDRQIHMSFYMSDRDPSSPREKIDYDKVKTLLELREKVEAISTWPFRIKTVFAGISVVFFSSIPVTLQILLDRVLD